MKSYEEMAENVLYKIAEHKKRRRKQIDVLITFFCICIVGGVAVKNFSVRKPVTTIGNVEEKTDEGNLEIKNITMVYDGIYCGEFVGDMYRPEGYSSYIGSALALKMSITEDENYKYSVIIKTYPNNLRNIDALSTETGIVFDEYCIVNDKYYEELGYKYIYYAFLTREQIFKLVEKNVECLYVGNGNNGKEKPNVDWESHEWIDWFCENTGDMYVIENSNIIYNPDIKLS